MILSKKYNILRNIWRMWPSVWPGKAPGWLLVWKVPSVTQVILILGMCESSWCMLNILFPSSPFGSKAISWKENPIQAQSMWCLSPQLKQPLVHKFLDERTGCWEVSQEAVSIGRSHPLRMVFRKLDGAVAMLKPMLVCTHYMYNLPQISVIKISML